MIWKHFFQDLQSYKGEQAFLIKLLHHLVGLDILNVFVVVLSQIGVELVCPSSFGILSKSNCFIVKLSDAQFFSFSLQIETLNLLFKISSAHDCVVE